MVTDFDAVNTFAEQVYQYDNWTTLVDNADEPDPEGDPGETTSQNGLEIGLQATMVIQSAGGQSLDFAKLEWALQGHLINRALPTRFAKAVTVKLPDLDETRLHWGDYVTETERVEEDGESLMAESHLRHYHFGQPFRGQRQWDKYNEEEVTVASGPVFNPRIDGRVLPNMSDKTRTATGATANIWIHPEAALTAGAETYLGQVAESWTLREAVNAICEECNLDEEFITNPTSTELTTLDDAAALEDIELPKGEYLPFYLDKLLHPLGFNWYVDPVPASGETLPRIRLFERGVGTEKELKFQFPGTDLDLSQCNVKEYEIARRIGDAINSVTVYGDVPRYELTLPLWPTWSADDDSLTTDDLNKQTGSSYEGKEHVHRKWAANEAGDYDGLRSDALEAEVPILQDVFPVYVEHRRTPEEPLTYAGEDGDKHRRPIFIEYSTDGGSTRQELTDDIAGNLLLLPDEIGILFNSDEPPSDIIDAGTSARLWMTCTIAGDAPISHTSGPSLTAVNGRTNELVLDLPGKFQWREVWSLGDLASVLLDRVAGADAQDDREAMEEFADKILAQYESAEIDCEFRLPGWHIAYEIGDLLTKIAGRDVSLNQATSGATPRYVQVVERRFEMGDNGPFTTLVVDRGVRNAT